MLPFDVTPCQVERHPGEGCAHLETAETCLGRGPFADLKDFAADSPPRPRRMHEKGAYLRRIVVRIEQSIFAAGAMVASIERLALAPASASGNDTAVIDLGFRYEVGAVRNQLGIHAKNALERLLQLLRRIVRLPAGREQRRV